VTQATGTTALAVSLASLQYSDWNTFTATFTPTSGGPVPATMSFRVGTQTVGTAPVTQVGGLYKAVWSGPMSEMAPPPGTDQMKPGAHSVYATTADSTFVASTGTRAIT